MRFTWSRISLRNACVISTKETYLTGFFACENCTVLQVPLLIFRYLFSLRLSIKVLFSRTGASAFFPHLHTLNCYATTSIALRPVATFGIFEYSKLWLTSFSPVFKLGRNTTIFFNRIVSIFGMTSYMHPLRKRLFFNFFS